MSTRLDFSIACDIKQRAPERVIKVLQHMTRTREAEFDEDDVPEHELFEEDYWADLLQLARHETMGGFPGNAISTFFQEYRYTRDGEDIYLYTLHFRRNIAAEAYNEYWSFLQWLAPHCETQGFVGTVLAEHSLHPELIYFQNRQPYVVDTKRITWFPWEA
jgi:hypothetical protein